MTDLRDRAPRVGSRAEPLSAVWVLTAALGVAGVLVYALALHDRTAVLPSPAVTPLLLAAGFLAAEVFTVHVHFREHAYSHSLTDLPLLIGLVYLSPATLVLVRLAGVLPALAFHRRQPAVKLWFNTGLILAETGVAALIHRTLLGSADVLSARGWIAAFGALLVYAVMGAVLVPLAISLHQRRVDGRMFGWVLGASLLATVANASLALVTLVLLVVQPSAAVLLGVVIVVLLLAYHAYGDWRQRHDSLQQLHEITQRVGRLDTISAVSQLLADTRELLRAKVAEIAIDEGDDEVLVFRLDSSGELQTPQRDPGLTATFDAEVIPRTPRHSRGEALLRALGVRDAMAVRLVGDSGPIGSIVVGDRLGDVMSFGDDDLRVFQTLAKHASVMLENSRLLERLRKEAADRAFDALHDSLTGLPNRDQFNQRVAKAIAERAVGRQLAVMLLDLDHFKEINDTLGHHTGDALLTEIGTRLQQAARPGELVARLGGDEFAVLAPEAEHPMRAAAIAERIEQVLRAPFDLGELQLEISASIGIALCPVHGETAHTLLQRADVAMYAAKRTHGRIEVYDPERDQHSPRRLALVGKLRGAIEAGELLVYFQPKAELKTGAITGVEALARWFHPAYGFVPPDEFIPLAEHSGLIAPLTDRVLRAVLEQWCGWQAGGIDLEVAVNLSTKSLLDVDLPQRVGSLLDEYQVPSDRLRLEITESSMMTDPHRAEQVLARLHEMGVGLSVDDFGTGYSSLAYLKRLPVDEIKIDRSFVRNMTSDENDAVIVRSTIDLGRNLGLSVVAEGVETLGAWERLVGLDCDVAQGFVLSQPVTPANFERWLAEYGGGVATARPDDHPVAPPSKLRAI